MKETRTELLQDGSVPYRNNGVSFGDFMRENRETHGLTLIEAAKMLEISTEYLSELETDKRYAPTGELLKRIRKVYGQDTGGIEFWLDEIVGTSRKDISADTIEFLRRNWFARYIVNLFEQADDDGQAFLNEEDLCSTIRDSIRKIAENKGVTIRLPEIDDDEDDE